MAAILGENDILLIPPGNRILKSLKTRAKVSVKPNIASISKRDVSTNPFVRLRQKPSYCSVQRSLIRFKPSIGGQAVDRFKIRSLGSIFGDHRELLVQMV